jgi:hypothetical protein
MKRAASRSRQIVTCWGSWIVIAHLARTPLRSAREDTRDSVVTARASSAAQKPASAIPPIERLVADMITAPRSPLRDSLPFGSLPDMRSGSLA